MKKPAQTRGAVHPGDRGFLVPWLGVAVALCVSIWLPSLPPLSNLYNHLARIHILAHRDQIAAYGAFYGEDWGLMPNLALDLIGVPLLAAFDLATVARLFLTATVLLWHAGCTHLGRVLCSRFPRRAAAMTAVRLIEQRRITRDALLAVALGLLSRPAAARDRVGPHLRPLPLRLDLPRARGSERAPGRARPAPRPGRRVRAVSARCARGPARAARPGPARGSSGPGSWESAAAWYGTTWTRGMTHDA